MATRLAVGAAVVEHVSRGRERGMYRLHLPLTNQSPTSIAGVTLALGTHAADDDHATVLSVQHAIPPRSNSAEVWLFDGAAVRSMHLAGMLAHPDRLTIHVRSIVLDSAGQADTVRLVREYKELRGAGTGVTP
jgi:hypothetical protein